MIRVGASILLLSNSLVSLLVEVLYSVGCLILDIVAFEAKPRYLSLPITFAIPVPLLNALFVRECNVFYSRCDSGALLRTLIVKPTLFCVMPSTSS